jgi:dipeptidyl aminopeptidase/acylaminoacyl peptidase
VRFEIRESPDISPALYAVETASERVRLLQDFNPQLSHFTLAKTELVHWMATDGKAWTGVLYYPVNYIAGRDYPLVIQTHGYSSTEFLPDGPFTTVFAAQPLANHDIAVLQVGGPDHETAEELGTSQEPLTYVAGFEGAIQHFVASGLADGKRIGIVGFSRTGWIVLYMLTHSHLPVAAAEVADNVDGSYVQYVLADSDLRTFDDVEKGASPFGKGQVAWMREAPGFNADKIRTPLRMELDSGPISRVLTEWEMFSNLRYLGRPVELSIIPDIEHGVHVLQNPAQRLASQGATVDWFRFWLKGEEDSSPTKTGQYVRWRKLRTLQDTSSSND